MISYLLHWRPNIPIKKFRHVCVICFCQFFNLWFYVCLVHFICIVIIYIYISKLICFSCTLYALCHVELSPLKVFSLLRKKTMNIYNNCFQLWYEIFLGHDVHYNGYNSIIRNLHVLTFVMSWFVTNSMTKMIDKKLRFFGYLSMIDEHTTKLYRV